MAVINSAATSRPPVDSAGAGAVRVTSKQDTSPALQPWPPDGSGHGCTCPHPASIHAASQLARSESSLTHIGKQSVESSQVQQQASATRAKTSSVNKPSAMAHKGVRRAGDVRTVPRSMPPPIADRLGRPTMSSALSAEHGGRLSTQRFVFGASWLRFGMSHGGLNLCGARPADPRARRIPGRPGERARQCAHRRPVALPRAPYRIAPRAPGGCAG